MAVDWIVRTVDARDLEKELNTLCAGAANDRVS